MKWQILFRNPADFVDLPRNEKKEMSALTAEQVGEFLKAAEASGACACNQKRRKLATDKKPELKPCRYTALFSLAITSGLRPGEYLGLQWPDIDLDRGTVMVRRALVPDSDGGWTFAEPKTKQSFRTVPLPPSVTRALVEHKRRQAAEHLAAGPEYSNQQLVFATPTGEPLDIRNLVNRHFKKILEAAKLPNAVRLYDLRHSCATLLLAQGEHPKIVSERLGHASITLTLDTYSHVLPTMQQQAAERLESVLFSSATK